MRHLVRVLLVAGSLVAALPTSGIAQDEVCELLPGAREATRRVIGTDEYYFVSGPARYVCPGEVVLEADSAVANNTLGEVELIGNVFFQDSVKSLTANWAKYLRAEARLLAREEVVLTDRKTGSTIEGTELEYLPANELRTETEAIIMGRPHAIFHRQAGGEPAPGDTAAEPLEVDADIMRILGESRFIALGQVELVRGKVRGFAREGEFDQEGHSILLLGEARLEGEGFDLLGERVEAEIDGESLRLVIATGEAALIAEDLDVEGHQLRIFFEGDEVHRLIALGAAREALAPDTSSSGAEVAAADPAPSLALPEPVPEQPVITSRDFRLAADSIDVLAPRQELEVVIAVGRASGVRAVDSLDYGLPEVISRDWLVGDTITGYFAREPDPNPGSSPTPTTPADSAGEVVSDTAAVASEPRERTTLQRLIAVGEGGGARSLYRMREKGRETEPPSANYLVANRIVLVMSGGEVSDVEADGPIEGIHLQPAGSPGSTPDQGGSTGAEAPAGRTGEPK